ncbi:MAG TPA: hypothetical protein VE078_03105 [Thermoanaerobaculia bacterium]|nr:hypothetical protein [Thermoanaerobaculia bacterium]
MRRNAIGCIFLAAVVCPFAPVAAATLILLDNSGSMGDHLAGGAVKAEAASQALTGHFLPGLPAGEKAALWAFGGDCRGLQLEGALQPGGRDIARDLARIGSPQGSTPLTWSIAAALERLARLPAPRHLVVITDGMDTCGGDPCAEVRQADARQAKITIHTVGLDMGRMGGAFRMLECVADASHNGTARVLEPGRSGAALADALAAIAATMKESTGELLVRLVDAAGGARNGISFVAESVDKGLQYRGETGRPLALPAGGYRLQGGGLAGEIRISAGKRAVFESASDLGRLVLSSRCAQEASFALLDGSGRTLKTGLLSGILELDLPPGPYQVLLTQFAQRRPVGADVVRNQRSSVEIGDLGALVVQGKDAAGRELSLPIEVFDDGSPGQAPPAATGETNREFRLPTGIYNVRVARTDARADQFVGAHNVRVGACERVVTELRQRSVLLVCGPPGTVEIFRDTDGRHFSGRTGIEIPLDPGRYNLRLPKGQYVANVEVREGQNRVDCK